MSDHHYLVVKLSPRDHQRSMSTGALIWLTKEEIVAQLDSTELAQLNLWDEANDARG